MNTSRPVNKTGGEPRTPTASYTGSAARGSLARSQIGRLGPPRRHRISAKMWLQLPQVWLQRGLR